MSSLVDTTYTTTTGIGGVVAANLNTRTTSFGRSGGFSAPAKGGKGETFGEQRFTGHGGGGGSDGGDDGGDGGDAVEFVLQQRIRLFDILGDIDNRKDTVKLSRKEIDELTVQGLEVCFVTTERARVDKAVLAELIATYPKRVSETSINNPAILVVHGEFNVSAAQLSIYANILQRAHDGIDGTGRAMTTDELGAALRKTLMGFYRKHCLKSDGTAKSKAAQNEPFTLDGPFRTTAFDGLDGIFIVRLAVNNGIAEAQKFNLETPVVEPAWAEYEETEADDANSPPAATSPPSTVHATTPPAALDHDVIVRQELAAIIRAGTAQNYNAMAKALNAAGITTARDKAWYAGTLKNALDRWGYGSVAEFVAAHADDTVVATVPNGDDDDPEGGPDDGGNGGGQPAPTNDGTVMTPFAGGFGLWGYGEVKMPDTIRYQENSVIDPNLIPSKNIYLEAVAEPWDVNITLEGDTVVSLVDVMMTAYRKRYVGTRRKIDNSSARNGMKTYFDLYVKPDGAEIRIGVLGGDPLLVQEVEGFSTTGADYRTSRRVIEIDAFELAETFATITANSETLGFYANGLKNIKEAMKTPVDVVLRGSMEGLQLVAGNRQVAYLGNERMNVVKNRDGQPAAKIRVRKATGRKPKGD